MVRLRRFVRASRIDQLKDTASVDLISAIKKLTPQQLKSYLRKFMPMDLVALIQKENPTVFAEAIKSLIYAGISGQNKTWMEWLNIDPSDVVSLVYAGLMNNDPNSRGILNEIGLDGSISDKFKYLSDIDLSGFTAEDDHGLLIPHCPVDSALGKTHPLWSLNIEGNELEMKSGLDPSGRCTSHEVVEGQLSPEQQRMVDQGQRTVEQEGDKQVLRCTFSTGKDAKKRNRGLHNLANVISWQITANLNKEIQRVRKEKGQNVDFKKYERREQLLKKQQSEKLSIEEQRELEGLEKYYRETQLYFSKGEVSLDQQAGGEEGDGRSLHETITTEDHDIEVLDYEELFDVISREEAEFLAQVAEKRSLRPILEKQRLLDLTPAREAERRDQLEKAIDQEINKTTHALFFQKTDRVCNTCGNVLKEEEKSCSYAEEMARALNQLSSKTEDINDIASRLQKDERAYKHFQDTHIESKISEMSGEHEVSEDDFDFGGFGDEPSEVSDQSNQSLKQKIESLSFDPAEKQALEGTNINEPSAEVSEQDAEKVQKYSYHLKRLLDRVFQEEMGEELANYLIDYGVA